MALVALAALAAAPASDAIRQALEPELVRPSIDAMVVAADVPVPLVATPPNPMADVELRWVESRGTDWPDCLSAPVIARSNGEGLMSAPALERTALLGRGADRVDYYCLSHEGRVVGEWGRFHDSEDNKPQAWLCWVSSAASGVAEPPCREHPNNSLKRTDQSLRD
jgi:hypothetical protein